MIRVASGLVWLGAFILAALVAHAEMTVWLWLAGAGAAVVGRALYDLTAGIIRGYRKARRRRG